MESFLDLPALAATAQHIDLLDNKIEKLMRARTDSWAQLLTAAARMYRAGELGEDELFQLHNRMRESFGPGFSAVWDQNMPITARRIRQASLNSPNGPNGSWQGWLPIGEGRPAPPTGMSVVYVLFDAANVPIYVGSTHSFRTRVKAHRREKPEAHSWTAYRCRDREHAYQLEEQLLAEHKPRLNKKSSR